VRIPNSAFAPYTNIATNLLFFSKGEATKEVWFYEHSLPTGLKSYNKSKPIRPEEFDGERTWWRTRTESINAWRVSIDEIRERNFNLDIKNPRARPDEQASLAELLANYRRKQQDVAQTIGAIRDLLRLAMDSHGH